ncbi:DNA-binding SARP family transcriptional activator/Tfp pilus assembly protein PilF [Actinokineospora baliensis]|uniref:AfsR/SARP family transcriptional regulator n=1 Tax=Actinokineospora baliensis TaxID=547056 RepID=UPI0019584C08|nr:tetratricopeptide repeat protein [Actinokineospora baliensis]MBM7774379.1 DNA-binding SARP family transcriptional activator/Tfp pilus assembly protein PilF [Actinokineospora baliensis]
MRVLGPVEVLVDGVVVGVGAGKLRALVGALAVRAGESVSTGELVGWLWGDDAPGRPRHTVQIYVMRLRRVLGAEAIETTADGYRLAVGVDLVRFERLLERARSAEPAEEAELLRAAEALWRGEPLADVEIEVVRERVVPRLWELRLGAVERRVELDLVAGRHEVIGELRALTAEHPLRERLWALLVRALSLAGRAGEAMAAYHLVRAVLADQLGVDPGPELRQLFQDLLDGPPAPTAATPVELPPDLPDFVGRDDLLDQVAELLTPRGTAMPIVAVVGPPGVGKTALAVHLAHRLHERFPDGRLLLNLHGYSTRPSTTAEQALAHLLRTLGVAPERVPLEVDAQSNLLRALLADRRALLVLDNASGAEQVRSLLPSGPGCAVLITSRDEMRGLAVTHGARKVSVGVLTGTEARRLLTEVLGAAVAAEPDAATMLIEACGALPLALRIAAANVEGSIDSYVRELTRRDRLRALTVIGDVAVSSAFDLSYAALTPEARRLFRQCGLSPTPDVTAESAAVLAGIDEDEAAGLLRVLATSHLIEQTLPGRFQLHDLLRLYAVERAKVEDSAGDREDVVRRLLTWYVGVANHAADVLYPEMTRLAAPRVTGAFTDNGSALSWLDGERLNIAAVVCHVTTNGPHQPAWLLADALRGYFRGQSDTTSWRASARAGLKAATVAGDDEAVVAMRLSLGAMHASLGDHTSAVEHYDEALALAEEIGSDRLVSAVLNNLACTLQDQGALDEAVDRYERAIVLQRASGTEARAATMMVNLGSAYWELGRLGEARGMFEEALVVSRRTGSRRAEAEVLDSLAGVHLDRGDTDRAIEHAGRALRLAESTGHPRQVAQAHNTLGAATLRAGSPDKAVEHHTLALAKARDLGFRRAQVGALIGLADAHRAAGRPAEAVEPGREALALTDGVGFRGHRGLALVALGRTFLDLGDQDLAGRHARRALEVDRETGHRLGQARALRLLGDVLAVDEPRAADAHWREALGLFAGMEVAEAAELALALG